MNRTVSLFSFFVCISAADCAHANQPKPQNVTSATSRTTLNNVNTFTLTKRGAATQVKQHFPGKVLNVKDKKHFYRVRMLQAQGKVVDYRVDKLDGTINKDKKNNAHSDNRR